MKNTNPASIPTFDQMLARKKSIRFIKMTVLGGFRLIVGFFKRSKGMNQCSFFAFVSIEKFNFSPKK